MVRDPRDEILTVKVRVVIHVCLNHASAEQLHTIRSVLVYQTLSLPKEVESLCIYLYVFVSFQLSHSWGQALGSLTLPLREVLVEADLVLDRWLGLDGALPESQILLRVVLKVLQTDCLFLVFHGL